MNARERVQLALTGQTPDRIPKALGFYPQTLPAIAPTTPEERFALDVHYVEFDPPDTQESFLGYLAGLPADVYVGSLAQLRTYHEWRYHPERGPARPGSQAQTVEDLAATPLPHLAAPQRHAALADRVQALHRRGVAVAGSPPHLGGELFENAWRLRGFGNFLTDLAARPALAHYLLDQLTAMLEETVRILAQAKVDILLLDDDVAMPTGLLISPATWRAFLKPRLAQVIAVARAAAPDMLVFYHSDGDFTALVPELVEIGVQVINPLQPDCMDALAIKRRWGDRLALWGAVGTATLWDHGSPQDVEREVRQRIETLGPAGLLLVPAYDVDFAPLENLVAFAEAVERWGCL
ncbi:MAG: hypothetical protein GX605_02750 [Chloroflexi bacterium]|nr:hypothetical protein [Chloroflexota bacterium]